MPADTFRYPDTERSAVLVTDTVYADVSSWQAPLDDSYPYPMVAFRDDFGAGIDTDAHANWTWASQSKRIQAVIAYVVFKPGQGRAIFGRVTASLGPAHPKLAVMIDMESGAEFAGPGNHSAEANELAELLAGWLGDRRRVLGYANHGDWASCWPSAPSWMKRVTADYGTTDPGSWGWQYYGGVADNPSPAGLPRSCPPFGSNVDLNVIHQPIGAILADLGLTETPTQLEEDDDMPMVITVDPKTCAPKVKGAERWPGVFLLSGTKLSHIATTADVAALTKAGCKSATLSLSTYKNLGGK